MKGSTFNAMIRAILLLVIITCGCSSGEDQQEASDIPVGITNMRQTGAVDVEEFVVFVYHRFGDSRHMSTNISLDDFKRQLTYLHEEGFDVVTLGTALNTPIPEGKKRVVITVDDGYKSFVTGAMPLLDEYGYSATLFVNTETVGADDFLSWSQLDSIRNLGIEIGNHSHSHAYFLDLEPAIYADSFRNDVLHAQRLFEEKLGFRPRVFAYPYGEYDDELRGIVRSLGFDAAVAQNSGVAIKGQDTYSLPRFPVSDSYSEMEAFKEKATARALHVLYENPTSPVVSRGEIPTWKLITREELPRGRIQCFVQGGFCRMDSSGDTLIVQSENPPKGRRVLYTITAQDRDGDWYWRTHLWITPKTL